MNIKKCIVTILCAMLLVGCGASGSNMTIDGKVESKEESSSSDNTSVVSLEDSIEKKTSSENKENTTNSSKPVETKKEQTISTTNETSEDTDLMTKVLTCFRNKDYQGASKYASEMEYLYVDEDLEKKMTKEMSDAYLKVLEEENLRQQKLNFGYLQYLLVDLDKDGKVELIVHDMEVNDVATQRLFIYKYENNGVKEVYNLYPKDMMVGTISAYPEQNSIVILYRNKSNTLIIEKISILSMKDDEIVEETIPCQYEDYDYMSLGYYTFDTFDQQLGKK